MTPDAIETRIDIMGSHESLLVVESYDEVVKAIQDAEPKGWVTFTEAPRRSAGDARPVHVAIDKVLTVRRAKAKQHLHTQTPAVIADRA